MCFVELRCKICGKVIVKRRYNGIAETWSQAKDLESYLRHLLEEHPYAKKEIEQVKHELAWLNALVLDELYAPL